MAAGSLRGAHCGGCLRGIYRLPADEEDSGKIRDLDFTVVGEGDVPGELARIIAQKREGSFRLTYADGLYVYLLIGEGPQQGGGYSVTVNELYLTDNAGGDTDGASGPEKGEASGADMSYPGIDRKNPVYRRTGCFPIRRFSTRKGYELITEIEKSEIERTREIERSIIKRFRKEIWRPFVRALNEYELIAEGDRIAVCISGGKDSMLLAKCMQEILRHGKMKFDLKFLVMDPGYRRRTGR